MTVKIPGKVMLAGEYTVLTGGKALAVTVGRHMTISVRPLAGERGIVIRSSLWPRPVVWRDGMTDVPSEPLVATVVEASHHFGLSSFEVDVQSELDVRYGIGSSSALRLGVWLALHAYGSGEMAMSDGVKIELARRAWRSQLAAQKRASGYDVLTQLVGGLIELEDLTEARWPGQWTRHAGRAETLGARLSVWVGGRGADTTTVMGSTWAWLNEQPERLSRLAELNEQLATNLLAANHAPGKISAACQAMDEQRNFFAAAPTFPRALAAELRAVPGLGRDWSWKTTGAGGEDALLVVGAGAARDAASARLGALGWHRLDASFTETGATVQAARS